MPNIQSAKKRVKVSQKKTLQNKMFRSEMKTDIRKYREALAAGDKAAAAELCRAAVRKIDMAASKGLIHKNGAARRKSRFAKALSSLEA